MKDHKISDLPAPVGGLDEAARGTVFSGAVLIMGASGIVAQLILLRELLITFLSNELTIGIILSNWLILEAAGSWLGKFIERSRRKLFIFVIVTCIFSTVLPLTVYFARTWKAMVGAGPGEGMGLHQIFLASFLVLLPVCIAHGALFTIACRLMPVPSRIGARGIGKVYFLETMGTIAGGLLFTFLMTTLMNSFEASFTVLFFNVAACILLTSSRANPERAAAGLKPERTSSIPGWALPAGAFTLLIVTFFLLVRAAPGIHHLSILKQWQGQNVVHYQNSVYGNTVVVKREGEYTYFTDGVPSITTPTPDIVFVEEFAHFPLLFHPQPGRVLVISGGAGGVINELLKHSITRIDYVELDPLILKLVRRFPTDLTETELNDPKVKVYYQDGRLFLGKAADRYDVILIGLTDPQDLQVNRFFTRQFFLLAHSKLQNDGIIAFVLPGSLTYLGEELKALNASILNTLSDEFPGVRVIPGDGFNLFLASPSAEAISCDTDCVLQRLDNTDINVRYLKPFTIRFRLDPRWSLWFGDTLTGSTDKRNEDFRPLAVYFSLSYWNAKFSPQLQTLLNLGGRLNLAFLAGLVVLTAIAVLIPVTRSVKPFRRSIPLAVSATGLTGMILELAIIFMFQSLYGIVFYWMGLLITAFMTGIAAGSLLMTRYMDRIRSDVPLFVIIEAALALFSAALPIIAPGSESSILIHGLTLLMQILFLAVSMLAGLLIGLQFPLAGKIYLESTEEISSTAGLLYSADLLGGWVGGIAGGVFLLPVLGLVNTCVFLGILKLASGFLVAAGIWKKRVED